MFFLLLYICYITNFHALISLILFLPAQNFWSNSYTIINLEQFTLFTLHRVFTSSIFSDYKEVFIHLTISNVFYFFLYKKKNVLISYKFSISGFWWIYMFWHVPNTISLFLDFYFYSYYKKLLLIVLNISHFMQQKALQTSVS